MKLWRLNFGLKKSERGEKLGLKGAMMHVGDD